ncbi:hypothetical protein CN384_06100 [Bacillus thuringiensis]|uniref:hypothetical protein n=1 Tax=Bacillus cereus group TaxID=86661 RepID=UPI000BF5C7C2|nr:MULTISPECIES: hypothetical protein [Bacillus cereus group]PEZ75120.1 hypothetical protein CN410_13440 [Bacillus anthracis]PFA29311.1 hypothetical protein CN384_06100 [Bacillus thuringiensis]PGW06682.1 hypothetical protein COD97_27045 [Bacillus cereus]
MNKELNMITEKYQYDKSIRKHAERYFDFHQRSSIHKKIETNDDVLLEKNGIENRLQTYKEVYPLVSQDIIDIERSLARYEIAVGKVIQCPWNFSFSAQEVLNFITNISVYEEEISHFRMRHACQD